MIYLFTSRAYKFGNSSAVSSIIPVFPRHFWKFNHGRINS